MRFLLLGWMRETLRNPLLFLLSVTGVALAVATVVAVDVANHSARTSFLAASSDILGETTHRVAGDVTDDLYVSLRKELGPNVFPVVEGRVIISDKSDLQAKIFGTDVVTQFGRYSSDGTFGTSRIGELIAQPYSVIATQETLDIIGKNVGDSVSIDSWAGRFDLRVVGLLETDTPVQNQTFKSMLLTDIATAQTLLGMKGQLSAIRIDLPSDDKASSLELNLPDSTWLESDSNTQKSRLSLTESFQTNLTALGLLGLLVAVFLVFNTMTFLVMRRRRMIGILRALGVTRREFISCVLAEVALIGIIASVIGFVFGVQLAKLLLALVERSIDNLYFPIHTRVIVVSPIAVLTAVSLGLIATIVATIPALREASQVAPSLSARQTCTDVRTPLKKRLLIFGFMASLVIGITILNLNPRNLVFGFAGIFSIVVAYMFLVPLLSMGIGRIMRTISKKYYGVRGVLACRSFSVAPGRASIAVSTLCLAISATVGVGVMIGSFRNAVQIWLDDRLVSDIYITTSQRFGTALKLEDIENLSQIPGVGSVGTARWSWLRSADGKSRVFAVNYGEQAFQGYQFKNATADELWTPFRSGSVIVSEPYAWQKNVKAGDTLRFQHNGRDIEFPVAGIYYDYSSDQGIVTMHRNVYMRHFEDRSISSAAVFVNKQADIVEISDQADQLLAAPGVTVWRNRELYDASLEVFDQTFAITSVLRGLAIVVALIAVISVLSIMQIERAKELAVQLAMGFSAREIWKSTCYETGMIGFFSGLLALPIGLVLAWLLIWVINQRSFGWTMQLQIDTMTMIEAVLLSTVAALLAGLLPAWRLANRTPVHIIQSQD